MPAGRQALRLKFVLDPRYGDHLRGVAHPERPDRVEAVEERLRSGGVPITPVAARDASDEEIERVHTRAYLELVERETASLTQAHYLSTGDTMVDAQSPAVARRAAGGAICALEAAVAGAQGVFALVRPPGHHAEPACGMGFCVFNNVGIAARAFQANRGGRGRVLVVDFDYHHGNGTEAIAGSGLSYVSSHAFPAYPGTGASSFRRGDDLVVNMPLPVAGISTEAFVALWEEVLPMAAAAVRPECVIVSAGFDYVRGDSVGDLGVGVEAAGLIAAAIRSVAEQYCDGAVAYVLEGGYDIEALSRSVAAIAAVSDGLQSYRAAADPGAIPPGVRRAVRAFFAAPGRF